MACPASARPTPPLVLTAAAAERVKADAPLRILAIGSSSTAGVGASRPDHAYPARLAHLLDQALGEGRVQMTNAGVSGESSPATLNRLLAILAGPERPDLVIWQVGTNDAIFGNTPERLGAGVAQGVEAAAAAQVALILMDQQYFPTILDKAAYERFVAAVDAAASAHGTPLLHRYAMMKQWSVDDPQGFRGLFWWDRFHMNDKGYACLAELLAGAVVDAVQAARTPVPLPPSPPGAPARPLR